MLTPEMWAEILTGQGLIALATLAFLEVVLGVDNIIFISILTNKLPHEMRNRARVAGIGLALGFRVMMLLGITWIIGFTQPLFTIFEHTVTGRDGVLFLGGLFLLFKSTKEIHHKFDLNETPQSQTKGKVSTSFAAAIVQIGLLDIVFSFDSILTAIGMTRNLPIMVIAVIISMVIMLIFAKRIATFIEKHISLQILALSFLILIGFTLIADAAGFEVPKGYIYFAVGFSLMVEVVNIRISNRRALKTEKNEKN
jgi:predicted tellurium resistance membrane protein TerC